MPIKIKRAAAGRGIIDQVKALSGIDINACLQCKKCTNGCPVAGFTSSSPSEIIKKLQLGAGEEILDSEIIWICASCATCFSPLPHGDQHGRGHGRPARAGRSEGRREARRGTRP